MCRVGRYIQSFHSGPENSLIPSYHSSVDFIALQLGSVMLKTNDCFAVLKGFSHKLNVCILIIVFVIVLISFAYDFLSLPLLSLSHTVFTVLLFSTLCAQ